VCELDDGIHQVSSTLLIGRSNITIKGNSSRRTILQRSPGFRAPLLRDIFPNPVRLTSITIRDLTFDGNRSQQMGTAASFNPELFVLGIKSILVGNCEFTDSPWIGFGFINGVDGVVVNKSYFANAVNNGIWADGAGGPYDVAGGAERCGTSSFPSDIVVANSRFEGNGGNGIQFDAKNVQIVQNEFRDNHRDPPPGFDVAGGQLNIITCADNVAIVRNSFTGASSNSRGGWADDIEMHGTNVAMINNVIAKSAATGITMQGSTDILVANWDQTTGFFGSETLPFHSGIYIVNVDGWRPAHSIIIDHANIMDGYYFGIQFDARRVTTPFTGVRITNNCLRGNSGGGVALQNMGPDAVISNNLTAACGPVPRER
jgi:hypothetical protein